MATIRFEDLGKPIQQLLKGLNGGYNDEDLALMEWVSVKDMAKIYEELNAKKKAETIWKELKKDLEKRKEEQKKKAQLQAIAEAENEEARKALEDELAAQEEAERAAEEKARRKKEKRERKRREAEELAAQEAAAAEAEAEALAAEEEAAAAEAEAEEERQRRKEEKKARKEERERQRQEAEAAAAAAAAAEEAEEEARLAEEKAARKAEKKRLKKEAQKLAEEQDMLTEQKAALSKKKKADKQTLAEKWEEHVKNHPLEFGADEGEVIEQVQLERVTKRPPKEFLKVKFIRIPTFETSDEGTCFYNLEVNLTNSKKHTARARYNQFVELKQKLGGSLDQVQAPFPGKTFLKLKGDGLEKRRAQLEQWVNQVIQGLTTTRSYKGVHLSSKQQLRGDAARAEAERQRMLNAAVARQALYAICGLEQDEE